MTASNLLTLALVGMTVLAVQASIVDTLVRSSDGLAEVESSVHPDLLHKFTSFAQKHGRKYDSAHEMRSSLEKFQAFEQRANEHQAQERGTAKHSCTTKFADLSHEEFVRTRTGHRKTPESERQARRSSRPKGAKRPTHSPHHNATEGGRHKRQSLPTDFDWRDYGVVTSVKDQGSCGDCYSFASTATLESSYALYYGQSGNQITNYAESETTDCSTGNYGCNGGWGYKCFDYVMSKPGITDESHYPFSPTAPHNQCLLSSGTPRYALTLGGHWFSKTEEEIQQALYDYGPIDISIDANFLDSYDGGILDPTEPAGGWDVNHEVLLVGYGYDSESGMDYWIAKNSWNTNWGESGFFRFRRGTNALSVTNEAVSIWFNV